MIDFLSIIVIALIIFFCVLFISHFCKTHRKYPYYSRVTLLTKAELNFYKILQKVIPQNQSISCKVRLADIINCTDKHWKGGHGFKISSKHIDFVIFDDQTTNILLCIELDDSSHALPHRKKRDVFIDKSLDSADIPILRVKASRGYDMAFLQKEIKLALRKN